MWAQLIVNLEEQLGDTQEHGTDSRFTSRICLSRRASGLIENSEDSLTIDECLKLGRWSCGLGGPPGSLPCGGFLESQPL